MEFEEPPPRENAPNREYWVDVATTLKGNPGKAGKTGPHSIGVATNIRLGKYVAFLAPGIPKAQHDQRAQYMKDHWAVTTRHAGTRDRQYVYVTWTGEGCVCRWCQ